MADDVVPVPPTTMRRVSFSDCAGATNPMAAAVGQINSTWSRVRKTVKKRTKKPVDKLKHSGLETATLEALRVQPGTRSSRQADIILTWFLKQRHRKFLDLLGNRGTDVRVLRELCKHLELVLSDPDNVVVRQGEVGNDCYIVLSGSCDVYRLRDPSKPHLREHSMFPRERPKGNLRAPHNADGTVKSSISHVVSQITELYRSERVEVAEKMDRAFEEEERERAKQEKLASAAKNTLTAKQQRDLQRERDAARVAALVPDRPGTGAGSGSGTGTGTGTGTGAGAGGVGSGTGRPPATPVSRLPAKAGPGGGMPPSPGTTARLFFPGAGKGSGTPVGKPATPAAAAATPTPHASTPHAPPTTATAADPGMGDGSDNPDGVPRARRRRASISAPNPHTVSTRTGEKLEDLLMGKSVKIRDRNLLGEFITALQSGDVFGELALIRTDTRRAASVIANGRFETANTGNLGNMMYDYQTEPDETILVKIPHEAFALVSAAADSVGMPNKLRHLHRVHCLRNMIEVDKITMCYSLDVVQVPARQVVYRAGTKASHVYLVHKGGVAIRRPSRLAMIQSKTVHDTTADLEIVPALGILGDEEVILEKDNYVNDAIATSDCILLRCPRETFRFAVHPQVDDPNVDQLATDIRTYALQRYEFRQQRMVMQYPLRIAQSMQLGLISCARCGSLKHITSNPRCPLMKRSHSLYDRHGHRQAAAQFNAAKAGRRRSSTTAALHIPGTSLFEDTAENVKMADVRNIGGSGKDRRGKASDKAQRQVVDLKPFPSLDTALTRCHGIWKDGSTFSPHAYRDVLVSFGRGQGGSRPTPSGSVASTAIDSDDEDEDEDDDEDDDENESVGGSGTKESVATASEKLYQLLNSVKVTVVAGQTRPAVKLFEPMPPMSSRPDTASRVPRLPLFTRMRAGQGAGDNAPHSARAPGRHMRGTERPPTGSQSARKPSIKAVELEPPGRRNHGKPDGNPMAAYDEKMFHALAQRIGPPRQRRMSSPERMQRSGAMGKRGTVPKPPHKGLPRPKTGAHPRRGRRGLR